MDRIISFGEVVWDMFPSGPKVGGAPLNVVLHLHQQGVDAQIISRVGADKQGDQLLDNISRQGVDLKYISRDENLPTSTVEIKLTTEGNANYTITAPVAWDNIQKQKEVEQTIRNVDVFVFGTLVARNKVSYDTLQHYIQHAKYCAMDVNFRAPHYEAKQVQSLLQKANLVKMNEEELAIICKWINVDVTNQKLAIEKISHHFNINTLVITKGEYGAICWHENECFEQQGVKIKIQDTVGAGDAFLATFLTQKLKHENVEQALRYANAVGAFVASKTGANPIYNLKEINDLLIKKKRND